MFLVADISDSIDRGWDEFFIWLPRLIGFLAILVIGYVVAKLVGGFVQRVLRAVALIVSSSEAPVAAM